MDSTAGPDGGTTDPDEVQFVTHSEPDTYAGEQTILAWEGETYDTDTCWIEAPEFQWQSLEDCR